ncbi:hypothetical protein ACFFX0_26315 [Citricoccus parietis]|uniref:Uncharacterized protein n=1 Tax=Citricoccus parietis TaxID=592307 RepID=A0ABV5G6E6_9MICC
MSSSTSSVVSSETPSAKSASMPTRWSASQSLAPLDFKASPMDWAGTALTSMSRPVAAAMPAATSA